jgi:hypothetical protein
MSSPGVRYARKSKSMEWMLLDLLDPQKAQAFPASYERARRSLVSHLLSMTAAPLEETKPTAVAVPRNPVADNPGFEWSRDPPRERGSKSAPIKDDTAGGKQQELGEFCYVSSFDRLTSKKPKASVQPAPLPMGVHMRNVLAVTAALAIGALLYASVGGGFPGVFAGVRGIVGDQAAKMRLILPGHDVGNLPTAPAPMSLPSFKETSADQAPSTHAGSSERLLYSTASIAFTPLK